MNNLYEKAEAARYFIRQQIGDLNIDAAFLTGTGLAGISEGYQKLFSIPYADIPHFPRNTVQSHQGILHLCKNGSQTVAVLSGRFHYYEGYTASEITFPIRVLKILGVKDLLVTNVSGGLNPSYNAGTIVAVSDHINLQPGHPLRGYNDARFGARFPDMMEAYDRRMLNILVDFAKEASMDLQVGVYLALQGPSLETKAEYLFAKESGADVVGMSTVPEVIVATQMNMRTTCLSVVSNVCFPIESITKTTLEEVIDVAERSLPNLRKLATQYLEHIR